jgi:hypothetical protein
MSQKQQQFSTIDVAAEARNLQDRHSFPQTMSSDLSLVLGGPLFRLFRRSRLSGDALEFLSRRALIVTMFVWLPLLFLSIIDGHAFGGEARIPFLYDIEAHVRFLITLPVLMVAEVIVHQHISPLSQSFLDKRIVVTEDLPRFNAAVHSARRAITSVVPEFILLVSVLTIGIWFWYRRVAVEGTTWYAEPAAGHLNLTLAGYWYTFISMPIFRFILLRWGLRLVIWFRFLLQVSRLNLHLTAAHPDRAGGIGFLGKSSYAFAPILVAQGALLAGMIASRILFESRSLLSFKMDIAGFVSLSVLFILGPLVMFTPQLERTKRKGLAEYGLLANRYVFGFEEKWIQSGAEETSELLGTPDLQSLADLGNSYSIVKEMRIVPFGLEDVTRLAAATALPLLPLTLTIFSVEELLARLVKIVF